MCTFEYEANCREYDPTLREFSEKMKLFYFDLRAAESDARANFIPIRTIAVEKTEKMIYFSNPNIKSADGGNRVLHRDIIFPRAKSRFAMSMPVLIFIPGRCVIFGASVYRKLFPVSLRKSTFFPFPP